MVATYWDSLEEVSDSASALCPFGVGPLGQFSLARGKKAGSWASRGLPRCYNYPAFTSSLVISCHTGALKVKLSYHLFVSQYHHNPTANSEGFHILGAAVTVLHTPCTCMSGCSSKQKDDTGLVWTSVIPTYTEFLHLLVTAPQFSPGGPLPTLSGAEGTRGM